MRLIKILGSVKFAIFLLGAAAIGVIAGTVIESKTGSHKIASRYIYANPLFLVVLWGFFVNILMATLTRIPFKPRHIPFIITHIGLLMVIGGTLLKITYGTQGSVTLKEGLTTQKMVVDESYALSFKKRGAKVWSQIPLKKDIWGKLETSLTLDSLKIAIRAYAPHGKESLFTWIKGGSLSFLGHPPIPLGETFNLKGREIIASLDPEIVQKKLTTLPALVFLQDPEGVIQGVAVDNQGELTHREYDPKQLKSLYAYDEGRGGYTVFFPLEEGELESAVTREFAPLSLPIKAEEERPLITLYLKDDQKEDMTTLFYLSILPTPVLKGDWLVKFEPGEIELPLKVRLRHATAILYPNTDQPKSYEAELYMGGEKVKLSMNNVYETEGGWRFYLSNMSPLDETQVKQVRLVVNHDPFKRWLTYPGAIILSIGILLLFFGPTLFKKKLV